MNRDQACRRIRSVLRARRWGGSGDPVFGRESVLVSVAPVQDYADQLVLPAAFVRPGPARADPERPGLLTATLTVLTLVSIPGDMTGERPLIGANRISKTSGEGRGILEVESELLGAVEQLDASGQFRISHRTTDMLGVSVVEDTGYHAWCEYGFEALLTSSYQHREPRAAAASESGGTVTVSWTVPDDATNLTGYVVRRVSGAIPAGFPTDGTDVAWSTGTSVTDSPGSGTWTYSVFAAYDDLGGSVEHDISDYSAVVVTF